MPIPVSIMPISSKTSNASTVLIGALFLLATGFLATAWAVPVELEKPYAKTLQGGEMIDLGTIGPGQTVAIEVNPVVSTSGIHGIGGQYDLAWVERLPEGWKSWQSKIYDKPLQVVVTAAPQAAPGDYIIPFVVGDEGDGEKLGNVTFRGKVRISHDIMDSSVTPESIAIGTGQPARYYVTISNKGSSGDVFEVRARGVKRWDYSKRTYVPARSSKMIFYEIVSNEEEYYEPTLEVVSASSNITREEHKVKLQVTSNLISDYRAMPNGMLIFPIFESAIYGLGGLIGGLFR